MTALLWMALAGGVHLGAAVSPSGPVVPANLLRLELRFDRPLDGPLAMDRVTMDRVTMDRVTLLDGAGQPIPDALLDIALPDRDGRGVALLFHPGRLKQGVGPNETVGPPLHAGDTVTLVVADPRLARPFRRSWRIGPAQQGAIDAARWRIAAPPAGSRQPVTVRFAAPVNASGVDLLAVADARGQRVAGRAILFAGETLWQFAPKQPWSAGAYALRVHPALEDPAGNRLCAGFEAPLQSERECGTETVRAFSVR